MLELNSRIQEDQEDQDLSILSKSSSRPKQNSSHNNIGGSLSAWTKQDPSTNAASNLTEKNEKIRKIKARMQEIDSKQCALQSKMENYIGIIQKQLKKKSEKNLEISKYIGECKTELIESRNDAEMLAKIVINKRKTTVTSRKSSPTAFRLKSNGKQDEESQQRIKSFQIQNSYSPSNNKQLSSNSPGNRVLMLARPKKLSPSFKDTNDNLGSVKRLSPTYSKKVKSFKF